VAIQWWLSHFIVFYLTLFLFVQSFDSLLNICVKFLFQISAAWKYSTVCTAWCITSRVAEIVMSCCYLTVCTACKYLFTSCSVRRQDWHSSSYHRARRCPCTIRWCQQSLDISCRITYQGFMSQLNPALILNSVSFVVMLEMLWLLMFSRLSGAELCKVVSYEYAFFAIGCMLITLCMT